MSYYLYIIYSTKSTTFYKGYSTQPLKRLLEHNTDLCKSTSFKGPWELVYLHAYDTKREALIEERRVKKLNRASLLRLISSTENEL